MAQVAVAWSMGTDGVTAPIVGTTSTKNLEELIGSLAVICATIQVTNQLSI
jgi:aryl-alcohol dehydrogenase-like predicted oxidoreductase